MEIATKEEHNPIKQDIKKGKLRYFTYGDIPFNYGCIPQTWEDPNHKHPDTGFGGDNDPVDVVEISPMPMATGTVTPMKVLGLIALIDENETDWKIIGVAAHSPLAEFLNSLQDVEIHLPRKMATIRDWFRMYKTTDGKPENKFAFDGEFRDAEYANQIVQETHQRWQELVSGKVPAGELYVSKRTVRGA